MPIRPRSETKLLDAADDLLFTRGIAATSVDEILERAGVSAATLYRGYTSKEALVAAALVRRHDAWVAVWDAAVERARTPEDKVLAVFDALDDFQRRPDRSRWCAFLGTAAEYADAPPEITAVVRTETETYRTRLAALAAPIVGARADTVADELLLVVSGTLAMRLRDPDHGTGTARRIARALLDPGT
jgi:AcrR family transcriptional regulator